MSQDHEKRVYSSLRFDVASNLWGIDLEGTVYCLEEPVKVDSAKKYKEEVIQKAEQPLVTSMTYFI